MRDGEGEDEAIDRTNLGVVVAMAAGEDLAAAGRDDAAPTAVMRAAFVCLFAWQGRQTQRETERENHVR